MHKMLEQVVVDDANGVTMPGWSTCHANEAGECNVWIFADRESGFGIGVGEIEMRQLKHDPSTGHYVAG